MRCVLVMLLIMLRKRMVQSMHSSALLGKKQQQGKQQRKKSTGKLHDAANLNKDCKLVQDMNALCSVMERLF